MSDEEFVDPEPYRDLSTGSRAVCPPSEVLLIVGKWVYHPRTLDEYLAEKTKAFEELRAVSDEIGEQ